MKVAKATGYVVVPKYRHDCLDCVFLGTLDGEDLYCCSRDGSYVRRFGSRGPELGSLGEHAPEGSPYALAAILNKRRIELASRWTRYATRAYVTRPSC